MSAVELSLVAQIRDEHERAQGAFRSAVEHAIRCGQLLSEAKASVPHGAWGGWLAEHFPASQRTAQGYMRLASHSDAQALAHLGIEGALKQLAAPSVPDMGSVPDIAARRARHEAVEADLRRLFVFGEWRQPGQIIGIDVVPDAPLAWAVLGVTLYHLDKAGAPRDFGYEGLEDYVPGRLADVDNARRGLEFEMAYRAGA